MDSVAIIEQLTKELSHRRFEHSLRTAYFAAELAAGLKENKEAAFLAGLLHDCARDLSEQNLLIEAKKNKLRLTKEERHSPMLLHGKIGAIFAAEKYLITDQNILQAIKNHTYGRHKMSVLEKIIFLVDYADESRTFKEAGIIRNILCEIILEKDPKKQHRLLNNAVVKKARYMIKYTRQNKWPLPKILLVISVKPFYYSLSK